MDAALMADAIGGFEQRLSGVDATQWNAATPCAEWDVRTLVNHVVGELLWVPPLLGARPSPRWATVSTATSSGAIRCHLQVSRRVRRAGGGVRAGSPGTDRAPLVR